MSDVSIAEPKPRLLVVDDIDDNRAILARRFSRLGYEIREADGGAQALELINSEPFDAVLLDIMMPGIDGLQVLQRVRETRPQERLPIIMVSAKSASEDVIEALLLGANDYITKPVDLAVAHARVAAQVGVKHRHDQYRRALVSLDLALAELEGILEITGPTRGAPSGELAEIVAAAPALLALCRGDELGGAIARLRRALDRLGAPFPDLPAPQPLRVFSRLGDPADRQALLRMLSDAGAVAELDEQLPGSEATLEGAHIVVLDGDRCRAEIADLAAARSGATGEPVVVVMHSNVGQLPGGWIPAPSPLTTSGLFGAMVEAITRAVRTAQEPAPPTEG